MKLPWHEDVTHKIKAPRSPSPNPFGYRHFLAKRAMAILRYIGSNQK